MRTYSLSANLTCISLACLAVASPLVAGGFEFYHQSSKGMAMGGAFVAQAEDPSAVFYNIGALALTGKKPKVMAGSAWSNLNESLHQGLPPGVAAETTAEQAEISNITPHAFAAAPLGKKGKIGFGVTSPFGFETEWADPDSFAGRYLSTAAELKTTDVTAGVSYLVAPGVGFGAAAIYRTSDFTLMRRVPTFNPASGTVVDAASLTLEATLDDGIGWTTGFLYQVSESFSIGASYKSAIEIDYSGEARFTQIETGNSSLDALIQATIPFDEDLAFQTRIEFPASMSLGLAFALSSSTVIELDASSTEWSSFDTLDLLLPNNPEFDERKPQNYVDSMDYRIGAKMEAASGSILRIGVAMEETPQPQQAVGPLFPDADRISYSVGYSKDWLDLAFVWVDVQNRTTQVNYDDFNGTYNSNAWIVGLTISK